MTDTRQAVNPLTGDLTTVRYRCTRRDGGFVEGPGKVVTPGLAIVPSPGGNVHGTARYVIVHTGSGYSFGADYCGLDVTAAAEATAALPVDWSLDREHLVADLKALDLTAWGNQTRGCGDWCERGDGPEPPSWQVSCKTCDWEWDETTGGFVTSKERADEIGLDHECEPWIVVTAPTAGETVDAGR